MKKNTGSGNNNDQKPEHGGIHKGLIEALPDAMFIVDKNGRVLDANAEAIRITGRDENQLLSDNFPNVFSEPDTAKGLLDKVFGNSKISEVSIGLKNNGKVSFNASMIRANGKPGTGAVIVLKKIAEKDDEDNTASRRGLKVLIVDDITLNQLLLQSILKGYGFSYDTASNGKQAVEMMRNNKYDIVLMDIQMPEMDGFEATSAIRRELSLSTPVIAVTPDISAADIEKFELAGMTDYIAKPIDEKSLYLKVMKYVKRNSPATPKFGIDGDRESHKLINLDYLSQKSGGDKTELTRMIDSFTAEIPALLEKMKLSVDNMEWDALAKAAHAILPTFLVMGMSREFEEKARKIRELARKKENSPRIAELLGELESACNEAVDELADAKALLKK